MKRKLICNFFMILGAAIFAGTILFAPIIFINDDKSAFYALLIISVLMIISAVWYKNREPESSQISGRDKAFLRALRTVNILAILVCFAFIAIMNFLTGRYPGEILHNVYLLIIPATVSIFIAALGLKVRPPIRVWNIAISTVALLISAALVFCYLSYMPKYSIEGGIRILRSEEELSQKDVFYPSYDPRGKHLVYVYQFGDPIYDEISGSNLFFCNSIEYYCDAYRYDEDGLLDVKGSIYFNPITGEYKYTREHDQPFSPGEWPEFDWNYMHDRFGQHNDVLNLYFREWNVPEEISGDSNLILSVSSNEWNSRLKDVMYPQSFPEDEARVYLKSMGEEALKTKLLKQMNELFFKYTDKTIEVYFFGIDIATYQNGEIELKL